MIYRVPFFLPWLFPSLVWKIQTTNKKLYLTFDDGPVPGPTDFVLETLAKHSVQATFFCIGDNVRKHPEVFKRIIDQGHTVGNHTYNHLNGWKTPLDKYVSNVTQCDDELRDSKLNLQGVKLFRPPYGKVTRSQIKSLAEYRIIMWDVLTHDYDKSVSPKSCLANSIRVSRPGSVIVFHDSVKAERNLQYTLPRYIDHFLNQGYSFHVLS